LSKFLLTFYNEFLAELLQKDDYEMISKIFHNINNEIISFYEKITEEKYFDRLSNYKKLNVAVLVDLTLKYFSLEYEILQYLEKSNKLTNQMITDFTEFFDSKLSFWIVKINETKNTKYLTIFGSSMDLIQKYLEFTDKFQVKLAIQIYTMLK